MIKSAVVDMGQIPKLIDLGDGFEARLFKSTRRIDDEGKEYNAVVYSVINTKTKCEQIIKLNFNLLNAVENKPDFILSELMAGKEIVTDYEKQLLQKETPDE